MIEVTSVKPNLNIQSSKVELVVTDDAHNLVATPEVHNLYPSTAGIRILEVAKQGPSGAPGGGSGSGDMKISAGTLSSNRSDLTFANSNGVSFGLNTNGVITGTVRTDYQSTGNYLTTAALSQDSSRYAGTNGAITGGSIIVNSAGVSVNLPPYITTAMQSNAATISNIKLSAGTRSDFRSDLTFADANGVSFGLNTNGVMTASIATATATAAANVRFSAGTLSSNRTDVTFADSNGVSFGLNTNGSITATVKTDYQTSGNYLTTAALSGDSSKYAQNWKLTGNTSGTTSSANGSDLWFLGGNNITISGSGQSIVISGANVGGAQTGISGLSAGTTQMTSGTAVFSNSNGVSFGVNGNTITATVKTDYLTTAALSQDSSKYAGTNGAIIGGSITVNTSGVSINLPAYLTTAMQSNAVTLSNIKVSAGTLSQTRSDITFTDSNGVSFGLETNGRITATVRTNYQSSGNYLTTAALSQDSSKYAGTNGAITGGSITVNTAGVSVNLPAYLTTAMQSNAVTLSNIKVSAGTLSQTRSDITFSNSNGVSFGLETNGRITATVKTDYQTSGAYLTTAMQSNAVTLSNIKLSGGTQSELRSDLTFANSNGISFGLDDGVFTATVRTDYQSAGNYLTTAALSQDSSKYAGINGAITGGSITVNTSGVSVNLPAYLTTAMASNAVTISNIKVSAGTLSQTRSDLTFADSNGIGFGLNTNGVITGSHNALTDAGQFRATSDNSQLQFTSANSNFLGTAATQSFQFTSDNSLSLGTGATASFRFTSQNSQLRFTSADSQLQFTSANSNFLGTAATQSFRHTSADTQLQFTSANSKFAQEWQLTGNSTGTGSSVQGSRLYFSGDNMLTISGSSNTIAFSVNTASLLGTGATASFRHTSADSQLQFTSANSNFLGTAATQSFRFTSQNSQLQFTSANSNFLGTGATASFRHTSADSQLQFTSANSNFLGTGATASFQFTSNNSLSLGTGATQSFRHTSADSQLRFTSNALGAVGISTAGNSSGDTGSQIGTYWFQGGANITLSQITSNNGSHTLIVSGATAPASPIIVSAGGSVGTVSSIVFSNSNGVSFGLNGSTITASAAAGGGGVNIAASNTTFTSGTVVMSNNGGALTISTGAQSVLFSVPATSSISATGNFSVSVNASTIYMGVPMASEMIPTPLEGQSILTNSTLGQNSIYFVPHDIGDVYASRVNFFFSLATALSASNATGTHSYIFSAALYSRGIGASTERISRVWSKAFSITMSNSSNTALTIMHPIGISSDGNVSYSTYSSAATNVSTYLVNSIGGFRMIPLGMMSSLTAGRYWMAMAQSTTNATSRYQVQASVAQVTIGGIMAYAPLGTSSNANSVYAIVPGVGTYSATTASFPDTVALSLSDIRFAQSAITQPYFNYSGYRASTNLL